MKPKLILFVALCCLALFGSGCVLVPEDGGYHHHGDWGWHHDHDHWHD